MILRENLSLHSSRRNEEMDATSVKRWIRDQIIRRGFNGAWGVASFSDVYNDLMPVQRKEIEKICATTSTFFRAKAQLLP